MRSLVVLVLTLSLALTGCVGDDVEPLDADSGETSTPPEQTASAGSAGTAEDAEPLDGPVVVREGTYPWHMDPSNPVVLPFRAVFFALGTVAPFCLTVDGEPFTNTLDLLQEGPLPDFPASAGTVRVTLAWDLTDYPHDHLFVAHGTGGAHAVSGPVANGGSLELPVEDEAGAWSLHACLARNDDALPTGDYQPRPYLGDLDVLIEYDA